MSGSTNSEEESQHRKPGGKLTFAHPVDDPASAAARHHHAESEHIPTDDIRQWIKSLRLEMDHAGVIQYIGTDDHNRQRYQVGTEHREVLDKNSVPEGGVHAESSSLKDKPERAADQQSGNYKQKRYAFHNSPSRLSIYFFKKLFKISHKALFVNGGPVVCGSHFPLS
jgi:DNA segregation ATPase FtsK/SpoIIIE-like protein